MFPTINKKETGVNLRRIMDMRGVKPKDIQEYLGFGCVQSVYRWLDGVSMPTVDNLYAISKMLQVPMDSIVCGNAGRTKSQMDLFYALKERFFKDDILGNGAIFASISKNELLNQVFVIPDEKIMSAYEKIAAALDKKIEVVDMQLQQLVEARDRLLHQQILT